MKKKTFPPRRSSTLLRRAAAFAVLMLAAQTDLWAFTVTLKDGREEGEVGSTPPRRKTKWQHRCQKRLGAA